MEALAKLGEVIIIQRNYLWLRNKYILCYVLNIELLISGFFVYVFIVGNLYNDYILRKKKK